MMTPSSLLVEEAWAVRAARVVAGEGEGEGEGEEKDGRGAEGC